MGEKTFALAYHDVIASGKRDATGFPGPLAAVYKLTPERFRAHLDAIAERPLEPGLEDGAGRAMLTFDDGGASSPWIAAELERRGWRGLFFVVTDRVGQPGFLAAEQIRELAAAGHEIGSHSHSHPARMATLGSAQLESEWRSSRELLGELLGEPPRSAAVPGGSVSRHVIEQAAAAGYERLFTSTPSSRAARHGELRVLGRFTVWAGDSPRLAAHLMSGSKLPRASRRLSWETRSAARRVSPRAYGALRGVAARRRSASTMNASSRSR
ncbi:MAG TPA: polysaccharide deacetylase family protein [Solirubrobacteraceae bacterium]